MGAIADLWSVARGAGIALDRDEAAALGAPNGETISIWDAMAARHGSAIAKVGCVLLWAVQFRHCRDQLAGVPMAPQNYVRAFVLLVLAIPFVGAIALGRAIVKDFVDG